MSDPLRPSPKDWSLLDVSRALRELHSDAHKGIRTIEVQEYRDRHGHNELVGPKTPSVFVRLLRQFRSPLVLILVVGCIVSALLGKYVDAIIITIAVMVNLIVSMFQERRADRAFALLKASESVSATVLRDGEKRAIPASGVVVGDILILEAGMRVSADARVLEAQGLMANESALTGEWIDIEKHEKTLPTVTPVAEQKNMLFAGTQITSGVGKAVVVAVGRSTVWGSIAASVTPESALTPLEMRMRRLSGAIAAIVSIAIVLLFAVGVSKGESVTEMILIAIALAIAVIPEGLPAAMTVVLAVGMEAILRRGGLIHNLLAAETLGSTSVILADKTGTLTKGEMRVASVMTLRGIEMRQKGHVGSSDIPKERIHDEQDTLQMAMLASDAFVENEGEALKDWVVRGRPVERAIILAGLERGLQPKELLRDLPRVDFLPFSSLNRFATSLHKVKDSNAHFVYFSGAPEVLLKHATHVYQSGERVEKRKDRMSLIMREIEHASREGLRLIGVAYIPGSWKTFTPEMRKDPSMLLQKGLTFAGFITLHDPVRDEVPLAIKTAKEAGVTVIMVTGDMPDTARAIATVAGITDGKSHPVYTGADIGKMTDSELYAHMKSARVFARMLPEDKLRLARVLQARGEIVAMTGDGINDAPTLRGADIGIAVGSGTEVAKESADLVLLENGMGVIVGAIEEGRRMFDNLRKIVVYLLATSFGDIALIGGSIFVGLPLPLLPAQIIWTNIVTEGLMNFAYAFEPKEGDIMRRDPRSAEFRDLLTPRLYGLLITVGVGIGLMLFTMNVSLMYAGYGIDIVRTMMFILISMTALVAGLLMKQLGRSILSFGLFANRPFWFALIVSLALLLLAFIFTPLRLILGLVPLSTELPWSYFGVGMLATIILVEASKWIFVGRGKR